MKHVTYSIDIYVYFYIYLYLVFGNFCRHNGLCCGWLSSPQPSLN
jgi:hypothetical protein